MWTGYKLKTSFWVLMIIMIFTSPLIAKEADFLPSYHFQGNIELKADSYFGDYPDDPVVEIPEGITDEEELEKWKGWKKEDMDERQRFKLSNPTIPGVSQSVNLEFYANPVPDLEILIGLSHQGLWGGGGTSSSLKNPLMMNKAYVRYYTEQAMYTLGRFNYQFGPLALLIGHPDDAVEGVTIHTLFSDTWITLAYNRLMMSMYRQYPYVSSFLLDDLLAMRFSRKWGENLIGLNLIANGFYDELGVSLDFQGHLWNYRTIAELGLVYPAWVYRELFPDHPYAGAVASINLLEDQDNLLTLGVGAMGKGFISMYGQKGMTDLTNPVKFNPNTGGIDLLYQRGLTTDLILGVNLVFKEYLDHAYQQNVNARYDMRILELRLQKYLSEVSNLRLSTAYLENNIFKYGKAVLSWSFNF